MPKSELRGWKGVRQWRLKDLASELELVRDDAITRWVPAFKVALSRTTAR